MGQLNKFKTINGWLNGKKKIEINVSTTADLECADGSEEFPFASLDEAKEEILKLADKKIYSNEQKYVVNIHDGQYYLDNTFLFGGMDTKVLNKQGVLFRGESIQNTAIKGSIPLNTDDFTKITDSNILNRIPIEARDKIYAINLVNTGYLSNMNDKEFELTINDAPGTVARYPNDEGVLSSDDYMQTGEISQDGLGFLYTDMRALRWTTAIDMYIYGMFRVDYHSNSYPASVNTINGEIRAESTSGSAFLEGRNFFVYNLLEELDSYGEYFYDKTDGNLYVYAENINNMEFEIQKNKEALISLTDSKNITFENMTLSNNYGTIVNINNGSGNLIKNCIIKNGTSNAVRISGIDAYNNGVENCEIYAMGRGGVTLGGGDRQTLTAGENFVANCEIHDFQRIDRSYRPAIAMIDVGNKALNNDIYNAYHMAISIYGNDLLIENNKIFNVCMETNDMGAIYAEGDWTLRGNIINHNYFYDIPYLSGIGPQAIYLDNGLSGTIVTNNIFENIGRHGVYINGGRDNVITNNIFVDPFNLIPTYGATALSDILNWNGTLEEQAQVNSNMLTKLLAVPYNEGPYTKYPNLANILNDEPVLPKYNEITGNVMVNASQIHNAWLRTVSMSQLIESYGCELNNAVYTQDPGFVNISNKNYTLLETSNVFTLFPDFEQISMNNFGRQ